VRWLRLLCADTRKRIRSGLAVKGARRATARLDMGRLPVGGSE